MFWVWTHSSVVDNNLCFGGISLFVHQARCINKEIDNQNLRVGKSRTLFGPVGCGEGLFNANTK